MRAIIKVPILFLCSKYVLYCSGDEESGNAIGNSVIDSSNENIDHIEIEKDFSARAAKFLSFNKEANKLRVEASFAVPLLTIPVGGETPSAQGGNAALTVPKIDINLKSVVTVASIFILVFLILPKILRIHAPPMLVDEIHSRSSSDMILDNLMKQLSETLRMYDMDFESCTRKALCWTMNSVLTNVKEGRAKGAEKLLDALSSMPYLKYIFGDTWLWSLVKQAILFRHSENENCEQFGKRCAITSKGLNLAAGTLLAAIRSRKL